MEIKLTPDQDAQVQRCVDIANKINEKQVDAETWLSENFADALNERVERFNGYYQSALIEKLAALPVESKDAILEAISVEQVKMAKGTGMEGIKISP